MTVTWRMPAAEDESGLKDLNQLADSIDADLHAIMHALMDAQRGFDLGDETILAAVGGLADGKTPRLRVGSMSYAAVVVPTMFTMTGTTLGTTGTPMGTSGMTTDMTGTTTTRDY